MKWTVLVPLKSLPSAKSRLAQTVPADLHAGLVAAIRADTLAAASAAAPVERVVVVVDLGADGDAVLVQSSPGLNGALRDGAAHAALHWPDDGVAALVGDLPALRADDLAAALTAAGRHDRAFVADAQGTGTTLLTARSGTTLDPRFGLGSASRHALRAVPLDAGESLRRDVDSGADLSAAALLGVGPATAQVLDRTQLLNRLSG